MKKDQHQLNWLMVSLIAFNMVWGLGNVVNNYSQQGISVVVSWVLILALYFIPYSLIVGQLGSTFKESGEAVLATGLKKHQPNASPTLLLGPTGLCTFLILHKNLKES